MNEVYVKVRRNGKYENVKVTDLTEEEFAEYISTKNESKKLKHFLKTIHSYARYLEQENRRLKQ